jgi:hypothetical protein
MADVVKFGTKPEAKPEVKSESSGTSADLHEYVWTCNECGCQSFQLLSTGYTRCVRCDLRSNEAREGAETCWRSLLPDPPEDPAEVPLLEVCNVIDDNKPRHLIKQSFSKAALNDDPVALCIFRRDGRGTYWSEAAENEGQLEWFRERLEVFTELVLRRENISDG